MKIEPVKIDTEHGDIATYKVGEAKIHIRRETDPLDPRTEWSNAWKWYSNSRRYSWDKENGKYLSVNDIFDGETEDGESIEDAILRQNPEFLDVQTIYLHEHGGIAISLGSFGDPWDSGVGMYAVITREQAEADWPDLKGDDEKLKERAYKCLEAEVETYKKYLDNEVYGYVVEDGSGEETDSCWGYYEEPEEVVKEAHVSVEEATMRSLGGLDILNEMNAKQGTHFYKIWWTDEVTTGKKLYTTSVSLEAEYTETYESPDAIANQLGYQHGEFDGHSLKVWNETEEEGKTNVHSAAKIVQPT